MMPGFFASTIDVDNESLLLAMNVNVALFYLAGAGSVP
jgi:hypothetical protein